MPVITMVRPYRSGIQMRLRERQICAPVDHIRSTADIRSIAIPFLRGRATEATLAIWLTGGDRISAVSIVATGDRMNTYMSPELYVIPGIILYDTRGVITAHNHLWEPCTPSEADNDAFDTVREAMKLMEWEYVDNVIVSPENYYSYRDRGHFYGYGFPVKESPKPKPKKKSAADAAPIHANAPAEG